uniref:Uncharacterized protein n=1 Tax=Lutzomyia longipalpis TaxID=7200 RepID=A0A1B0CY40_LUTLO
MAFLECELKHKSDGSLIARGGQTKFVDLGPKGGLHNKITRIKWQKLSDCLKVWQFFDLFNLLLKYTEIFLFIKQLKYIRNSYHYSHAVLLYIFFHIFFYSLRFISLYNNSLISSFFSI